MTNSFRTDFNFGSMMPGIDLAGKYFNETQEIPNTGGIPDAGMMTGSSGSMSIAGLGPRARQFLELREQLGDDLAMKVSNLDTTDANTDARLFDFLERQTDTDRLAKTLALKNKFEADRLAQAAPYNLLYQIPKTIMQGAVLPATVALGGAQRATEALARMGNVPIGGFGTNPAGSYNFS